MAAKKLTRQAAETYGPMYLRFTRDAIPQIYDEDAEFVIGKAIQLKEGKDVAIIANGDTVRLALDAAKEAIDYVTEQEICSAYDTRIVYETDEIKLLTPIPRPNTVRCFSLSEKHMLDGIASMQDTAAWGNTKPSLTKMPEEWYNLPTYYKTGTTEIYGSDEIIPWPELTNVFDFELEIAVIIGKEGRYIPEEEGEDYI